jgi:hypothetical protein
MQGTTGRVIVGLLWLLMLVVVAGAWSAGARSAKAAERRPAAELRAPVHGTSLHGTSFAPADEMRGVPRVDLYGNEIEAAVGEYHIDHYGDVYERHSPETAIVELTAPSL